MYQIEELDVDRFVRVLGNQRYKNHWVDYWQNMYDQMHLTEFKIQKWWANKIDLLGKNVAVLNSGIGFYAVPLCFEKGAASVNTYDMCPITGEIAWEANNAYDNYNHDVLDIIFDNDIFKYRKADVYINTSCEHSYEMKNIIPNKVEVVLSANNLTKRGHINKIASIDQLAEQAGTDIEYKFNVGRKVLERGEVVAVPGPS